MSVRWTAEQAIAHEERLARVKPGLLKKVATAVDKEIPLHNRIIEWCLKQWPRIKYIHANPAVKSTIAKGANDFFLFLPGGKILLIECKTRDGKLSKDQLIWGAEMRALGHTVHTVRSMEEFLTLINNGL